jgi:hypothetical protein
MHACLLPIYNHASPLLIYYDLSLKIGHDHVLQCCLDKDRFFHHAYVMHSAISFLHVLELPNDIKIADRVACCSYMSF